MVSRSGRLKTMCFLLATLSPLTSSWIELLSADHSLTDLCNNCLILRLYFKNIVTPALIMYNIHIFMQDKIGNPYQKKDIFN